MDNTTFFGVKGGQGTSLVAAAFALQVAESMATLLRTHDPEDTLALLGMPTSAATMGRIEDGELAQVNNRLWVTDTDGEHDDGQLHTVWDLGTNPSAERIEPGALYLVIRPCYLALRKALQAPVEADGIVLVGEPQRALQKADVEDVLGIKVMTTIPWRPAIATAVDAGLLARRLPTPLKQAMHNLLPVHSH